jgi:DNA-binding transcriptional regulator YiaG
MPFCHLRLVESKPKNDSYLWKTDQYPAYPRHIGEQIKKRRFDLKMTALECRKILGVDKSTLVNWERGRHRPSREHRKRILEFLGKAHP